MRYRIRVGKGPSQVVHRGSVQSFAQLDLPGHDTASLGLIDLLNMTGMIAVTNLAGRGNSYELTEDGLAKIGGKSWGSAWTLATYAIRAA